MDFILSNEQVRQRRYNVGRAKLIEKSDYFAMVSNSPFPAVKIDEPIKDVDPDVFAGFVTFINTGQTAVNPENLLALLGLAKRFVVDSLLDYIGMKLKDVIVWKNLVTLLQYAKNYDIQLFRDGCEKYLTTHFSENDIDKALATTQIVNDFALQGVRSEISRRLDMAFEADLSKKALVFWVRIVQALSIPSPEGLSGQFERVCSESPCDLGFFWSEALKWNNTQLRQLCASYTHKNRDSVSLVNESLV